VQPHVCVSQPLRWCGTRIWPQELVKDVHACRSVVVCMWTSRCTHEHCRPDNILVENSIVLCTPPYHPAATAARTVVEAAKNIFKGAFGELTWFLCGYRWKTAACQRAYPHRSTAEHPRLHATLTALVQQHAACHTPTCVPQAGGCLDRHVGSAETHAAAVK
jgi:hypothetical protein